MELYLTKERVSVGKVNEEIGIAYLLHDEVSEPGGDQLEVTQDFYHVLDKSYDYLILLLG